MLNGFLWDGSVDRHTHRRTWERLCLPIKEGGLGFKDFTAIKEAFSMKLWVRLREGKSLWAHFMPQKYFAGIHPFLSDGSQGSHTWRRLGVVRELAEEKIFWKIMEGKVDFWRDKWVLKDPLISYYSMVNPPPFLVLDFFDNSAWNV